MTVAIPSRRNGWSSTVRTRIGASFVAMAIIVQSRPRSRFPSCRCRDRVLSKDTLVHERFARLPYPVPNLNDCAIIRKSSRSIPPSRGRDKFELGRLHFVQRLYSMFPTGGAGGALLLLRLSVAGIFLNLGLHRQQGACLVWSSWVQNSNCDPTGYRVNDSPLFHHALYL